MIEFRCQCGRMVTVDSRFAGKTGRCGFCGQRVRIPDLPGAAAAPRAGRGILEVVLGAVMLATAVLPWQLEEGKVVMSLHVLGESGAAFAAFLPVWWAVAVGAMAAGPLLRTSPAALGIARVALALTGLGPPAVLLAVRLLAASLAGRPASAAALATVLAALSAALLIAATAVTAIRLWVGARLPVRAGQVYLASLAGTAALLVGTFHVVGFLRLPAPATWHAAVRAAFAAVLAANVVAACAVMVLDGLSAGASERLARWALKLVYACLGLAGLRLLYAVLHATLLMKQTGGPIPPGVIDLHLPAPAAGAVGLWACEAAVLAGALAAASVRRHVGRGLLVRLTAVYFATLATVVLVGRTAAFALAVFPIDSYSSLAPAVAAELVFRIVAVPLAVPGCLVLVLHGLVSRRAVNTLSVAAATLLYIYIGFALVYVAVAIVLPTKKPALLLPAANLLMLAVPLVCLLAGGIARIARAAARPGGARGVPG